MQLLSLSHVLMNRRDRVKGTLFPVTLSTTGYLTFPNADLDSLFSQYRSLFPTESVQCKRRKVNTTQQTCTNRKKLAATCGLIKSALYIARLKAVSLTGVIDLYAKQPTLISKMYCNYFTHHVFLLKARY